MKNLEKKETFGIQKVNRKTIDIWKMGTVENLETKICMKNNKETSWG